MKRNSSKGARSRWAMLRDLLKPLWWYDLSNYMVFEPERAKRILKYMRWLRNKQILIPDGKGGRLVKVLGIELMAPKHSCMTVYTCLVSGTTDDGQLVRLHFRGGVIPQRYDPNDPYVGEHVWRAITPKYRALLLAQELEGA